MSHVCSEECACMSHVCSEGCGHVCHMCVVRGVDMYVTCV